MFDTTTGTAATQKRWQNTDPLKKAENLRRMARGILNRANLIEQEYYSMTATSADKV